MAHYSRLSKVVIDVPEPEHDLELTFWRAATGQPLDQFDRRVRQVRGWWIMRDPAGLPFCVIPARPGSLNDDNAQRWA